MVLLARITYRCNAEMVSGNMIYVPGLMTIGPGIRVILRILPQQFVRLSVGMTMERNLYCVPLKFAQVA
jgi:hypothetical protein